MKGLIFNLSPYHFHLLRQQSSWKVVNLQHTTSRTQNENDLSHRADPTDTDPNTQEQLQQAIKDSSCLELE
jgi:hypothetical protein